MQIPPGTVCLLCLADGILAAQQAGGYHLLTKIPLGAAEGGGEYFDYITVDAAARRGFISDSDPGQVIVFDLKTLKKTGRIKADEDAVSILYDPVSKHIFVFNGRPGGKPGQAVAGRSRRTPAWSSHFNRRRHYSHLSSRLARQADFVDTSDFDAPADPAARGPASHPGAKPGTFHLLIYGQ